MTMRALSRKLGSVGLALGAVFAAAGTGPSALGADELTLSDRGPAPEFTGIQAWLNSPPLTMSSLRGRTVLVQFWTYSCINCLRTLPFVTKWYAMYKEKGFIVIGVHTPEFAFEKETSNVQAAIRRFGVTYPVAQDNHFSTWNAYHNQYWPSEYLIDKSGHIVASQFGEGNYQQMENAISLLVGDSVINTKAEDPDLNNIRSSEMYFGAEKNGDAIVSLQNGHLGERLYARPQNVPLNRFAFYGTWKLSDDNASLLVDGGEILLRFNAPKVNLVAGSPSSQTLSVTVDGEPQPPVTVQGNQLYRLYTGTGGEHVLRLTIPKGGLSAFTFSFG